MTFSKKTTPLHSTPLHSTPLHSTPLHSTHSSQLFKIFFSLLTLSTAFLQKASGPGKNKVHHVNQLIEPDLMMYIHMAFSKKKPLHPLHSTELFKIFFSLLTLSTAFLQKACGPGKISLT